MLEVCQFSRDASVAEAWLIAQEPYLSSVDYGHTVDSVEKLLKRHEAFEKSTATWDERFTALERLTTVSSWSKEPGNVFNGHMQTTSNIGCGQWIQYVVCLFVFKSLTFFILKCFKTHLQWC